MYWKVFNCLKFVLKFKKTYVFQYKILIVISINNQTTINITLFCDSGVFTEGVSIQNQCTLVMFKLKFKKIP